MGGEGLFTTTTTTVICTSQGGREKNRIKRAGAVVGCMTSSSPKSHEQKMWELVAQRTHNRREPKKKERKNIETFVTLCESPATTNFTLFHNHRACRAAKLLPPPHSLQKIQLASPLPRIDSSYSSIQFRNSITFYFFINSRKLNLILTGREKTKFRPCETGNKGEGGGGGGVI